jgi:hypothetical protein
MQMKVEMLTIGVILLISCSCNTPVIKNPVLSCVQNYHENIYEAGCGQRDMNIKRGTVGEFVTKLDFMSFEEMSKLSENKTFVAFPVEVWKLQIEPYLKELHDMYNDNNQKLFNK